MTWSIGGKTLDFTDDIGLRLLGSSPHFQKIAHLPVGDPAKLADLEDGQFGVVFLTKGASAIRKYPLNDLTNTVLSNVYFEMTHSKLPPEAKVAAATMIKSASEAFGVQPFDAVAKYASEEELRGRNYVRLDKVASSMAGNGEVFKQLHDAYAENRDLYTRSDKIALAKSMAPAAEKFGFEVHEDLKPFILKNPEIDKEAMFSQCAQRKALLQGDWNALHLMDEFIEKAGDFDPGETVRLLETFDRQFNLNRYWDRGLEPNLILREKVAYHDMPIASPVSMGMYGTQFSEEEIKEWVSGNGDLLKKMFGKELAQKIKADPKSLWNLPQASRDFLNARIEASKDSTPAQPE